MLSGVGPKEELEKHRIPVRIDLPGVGANLQDRYEVGVVNRVKDDWGILKGAKYKSTDPQYADWLRTKNELEGSVYGTNGAVLAAIRAIGAGAAGPGSLLLRRPRRFPRLLAGLFRAGCPKAQLSHLGRAKGPHQQQGRRRTTEIGQSA